MANNEARQDLDRQKMRDIGRVLGFFSAYSELQTGMATYRAEYDATCLCDPKVLGNPKLLKKLQGYLDPHTIYLKEDDCRSFYADGWNEGHTQGAQAYETSDLELIGEIARLAWQNAAVDSKGKRKIAVRQAAAHLSHTVAVVRQRGAARFVSSHPSSSYAIG